MNFKETFLQLTEYTTPYKFEVDFELLLFSRISGLQKDKFGNYHKFIGNNQKTMFTCHLDNYCKTKEKINHVINDNIISTDETTILGADNKAGVLVLLYLIENNVPGHYCFFVGEESPVSGGLYGSSMFAQNYDMYSDYKRAIAFDRKKTGSIITRQAAQFCCSDEFANELVKRFAEQGMEMAPDPTGYYTDTSSFMEDIPECTNISVGVWNEHTVKEYVDLSYVEEVAIAASKINWETLPAVRTPKYWMEEGIDEDYQEESKLDVTLFKLITSTLSSFNFICMNRTKFYSNKVMSFNHWFREFKLEIIVNNGDITINNYKINIDYSNKEMPISDDQIKEILLKCKEDMLIN